MRVDDQATTIRMLQAQPKVKLMSNKTDGRTHYDGCWAEHPDCAQAKLRALSETNGGLRHEQPRGRLTCSLPWSLVGTIRDMATNENRSITRMVEILLREALKQREVKP